MALPVITSITPLSGPAAGGTMVSITGTALAVATAVAFGATPATAFASLSATLAVAESPAGTGSVHVTLTTAGGTSAISAADVFTYSDGLFTEAEARTFNSGALADIVKYPAAEITAKEAEIRESFVRICGVQFVPTMATDEVHDGDGSSSLMLDWPLPISVDAASIDGVALTAAELLATDYSSGLALHASGKLVRRSGVWTSGDGNVLVTYKHGYAAVPYLIKRAALLVAVSELPTNPLPPSADSYQGEGVSYTFGRGDGWQDNWYRMPDVVKALRLYNYRIGIA
jgi:hypothetical protein